MNKNSLVEIWLCGYLTLTLTYRNKTKYIMESFKKGIKKLSLENKELLYKVRCTNYIDNRRYYVQNGKWARAESFNTKYAFSQDKVHFSKLPKDAIYKATVIENNSQNRNLYNL